MRTVHTPPMLHGLHVWAPLLRRWHPHIGLHVPRVLGNLLQCSLILKTAVIKKTARTKDKRLNMSTTAHTCRRSNPGACWVTETSTHKPISTKRSPASTGRTPWETSGLKTTPPYLGSLIRACNSSKWIAPPATGRRHPHAEGDRTCASSQYSERKGEAREARE